MIGVLLTCSGGWLPCLERDGLWSPFVWTGWSHREWNGCDVVSHLADVE